VEGTGTGKGQPQHEGWGGSGGWNLRRLRVDWDLKKGSVSEKSKERSGRDSNGRAFFGRIGHEENGD